MINCDLYKYKYEDRIGNLDKEAVGVVKSEKHFPIFLENGCRRIFKPLSKTKPFTTPLFSYSEVFWSTIINKYFDSRTPIYNLALCDKIDTEMPKYYNRGVMVDSLVTPDQKLVNLLEYFMKNPDSEVDINEYINYCCKFYDYVPIFKSKFFRENPVLGEDLARQVLYSILRADQNFHYENVAGIEENGIITRLAPPIDHEFSTMFMYPDDPLMEMSLSSNFLGMLCVDDFKGLLGDNLALRSLPKNVIVRNIEYIIKNYPGVAEEFLNGLFSFITDMEKDPEDFELYDNGFLVSFNSDDYKVGELRYKEGKIEEADKLAASLPRYSLDILEFNKNIQEEILHTSKILYKQIQNRM